MKEKDLKRLSRADLLEMLIDQSKELQQVREKLQQAEAELEKREIAISNAGSIAEASLMLNGVFEAAQAACKEYVENTHKYCERHEPVHVCSCEPSVYARPMEDVFRRKQEAKSALAKAQTTRDKRSRKPVLDMSLPWAGKF